MIRRILIPLDPSEYSDTAMEIGSKIALQHNAEVTGIVILDVPGLEKSIGAIPPGGIYYAEQMEKHKLDEAEQKISQVLADFKSYCEGCGIKHSEAEYQGIPGKKIAEQSLFYDLVIMGLKTFYTFEGTDTTGVPLTKYLDKSCTPVFGVTPNHKYPDAESGQKLKALIPFNGSLQAVSALQRFAHLAIPDKTEIKLVMADKDIEEARYYLDNAKTYLEAYGFNSIETDLTMLDIKEAVDKQYFDWADICVVGAHSKKFALEFMVGSLTNYLIDKDEKPVFIGA